MESQSRVGLVSWTEGDFVAGAALESFRLSKYVVYPAYYEAIGQNLGPDFRDRMRPIVYKRIQMAGVRLANLLEQALTRP